MRAFDEKQVSALAPNAAAAANGKKISAGGGFVSRFRSADDSFYMGECKGSGKSNYKVSADFIEGDIPTFRCSCPSRQFPCKHGLALLYEITAGKEFEIFDIPEDILEKREKKEARAAKKEEKLKKEASMSEDEKKESAKKSSKASKAAKEKKIRKQLEGLELMKKMTDRLLLAGLASMGSVSLKSYRELSKQLGDYYLPGPQVLFNRLIVEMEEYQKDSDTSHYSKAVEVLKRLRALEKKSKTYLEGKLEKDLEEDENDTLYEGLGGIWKLEHLSRLGLKKDNVRLIQLSFDEFYDRARNELIDKAYWFDTKDGEISCTLNYKPLKALKYVKSEDSCFDALETELMNYYPGGINKRIRWENFSLKEKKKEDFESIKKFAYSDISAAAKIAKNELKNILSDDECAMLISFKKIMKIRKDDKIKFIMEDGNKNRIELCSKEFSAENNPLDIVPYEEVFSDNILFGKIFYNMKDKSLCMEPCSIVTDKEIIRLGY